jgi:uncharacterized repeat protein (TIGR03837 family)
MAKTHHWDVFCRVVDNYGDIGICWRLSQQLVHEHGLQVRLFIDDIVAARHLISTLALNQTSQLVNGVEICPWPKVSVMPAHVVIATFGCELPETYSQQLATQQSVWINLEYLSAETWVSDFHAQISPQPKIGVNKHFFFPGFFPDTGGLLRERHLLATRDAFLDSADEQAVFWKKLGLDNLILDKTIKISLFCYPQAHIRNLFAALASIEQTIHVVMPFNGDVSQWSTAFADCTQTKTGASRLLLQQGKLNVHLLPFLSQADYDHLLWASDFNFVRGEDSWIRAIWAGKPFIWQPYWQADAVHLKKMEAFLAVYAGDASVEMQDLLSLASLAWSAGDPDLGSKTNPDKDLWPRFINQLPALRAHAQHRAHTLAQQSDLATKLVIFSENLINSQV